MDQAIVKLHSLIQLMGGLIDGQAGGRYDTLSNLEEIGGPEGKALLGRLWEIVVRIQEAWTLLCEIKDNEVTAPNRSTSTEAGS